MLKIFADTLLKQIVLEVLEDKQNIAKIQYVPMLNLLENIVKKLMNY